MLRSMVFAAVAAIGLSSAAEASMLTPVMPGKEGSLFAKIAEGCGRDEWRGPHGACHRFEGPRGHNRGTDFACPDGYHIGDHHERCFRD